MDPETDGPRTQETETNSDDAGQSDPWIGVLIADRYRLTRKLGEGGMGAVYAADHVALRKRVAVKILHTQFVADRELVARFEREAMSAANLEHPNIVAATDFGKLPDGTLFLVMEYADGRSLRREIASVGKMLPSRVMRILRQIAAALMRAHSLGIVHRDLKPENVVVIPGCEHGPELVKVIDFGIARVSSGTFGAGATALTQLGAVFGTPQYMAPEQAMGQVVDAAADQYAFGVLAFELLTGEPPYQAEEMVDVLQMHVGAPIPRISLIVPELSPAVDAVFDRLLAKLPRERFDSVTDAVAALEIAMAKPRESTAGVSGTARTENAVASSIANSVSLFATRLPLAARTGLVAAMVIAVLLAIASAKRPAPAPAASVSAPTRVVAPGTTVEIRSPMAPAPTPGTRARTPGASALASGLGAWRADQFREATRELTEALRQEPALAEDPLLQQSLTLALGERSARRSVESLLENTELGQSRSFVAAVAARGFRGGRRDGVRILRLIRNRTNLLPPADALRVELREARDCVALEQTLTALESSGAGPGQDEARRIRSGDCDNLPERLCRSCLGRGGGGADDEEN